MSSQKRLTVKGLNEKHGPEFEVYATGGTRGNVWAVRHHPSGQRTHGLIDTLDTAQWVIEFCRLDTCHWRVCTTNKGEPDV